MTKRLIDAAQAVLTTGIAAGELEAALDEARQPVTVTEEQAVELLVAFNRATDMDDPTQAEIDGVTAEDRLEIAVIMVAILEKARELGL